MKKHILNIKNSVPWHLVESMVVAFTICLFFELTTSNVLYVLVAALYIVCRRQENSLNKQEKWVSVLLSVFFSICMILGKFETVLDVDIFRWPVTVLVCAYGFYLCFYVIIGYLLAKCRDVSVVSEKEMRNAKKVVLSFVIALTGLLLVWGVGLFFSYPGNTTTDSNGMINMALGNRQIKLGVPIVYIMPIKWLWNIGQALFLNPNAYLAVVSAAHVLLVALAAAYLISRLYAHNVKKWICVITWMFYAFVPYNVQLSHTIWKDIPFAVFTFLFMILIWELSQEEKTGSKLAMYARLVLLVIAGAGLCLMRNNGLFAYIFFLPFAVYMFYKNNKKVLVALVVTFVLVRVIQGPVYDHIMTENARMIAAKQEEKEDLEKAETKQEATSSKEKVKEVKNANDSYNASGIYIITIQQLGRVVVDRADISSEDYERLNKVVDVEKVKERYDPYCMDGAASGIRYKVPKSEYLKEWLYFGTKYPIQYILAWKDQTFGYWYPDIQYWVYTDQIKDNELGLYKDSILNEDQRYEMMLAESSYKHIPVYGLLWSIGFVVWVTIFFTCVTFLRKGLKTAMVYVPLLGVWGTLLVATPVYAEFRYIYAMFLCLPLSVLLPFITSNKQQKMESE